MDEFIFNKKMTEAFAELKSSKKSARIVEAKTHMQHHATVKDTVRKNAEKLSSDIAYVNAIPNINRYQLLGRTNKVRILANANEFSMESMIMPHYRGDFFLVDQDNVSKRTYRMTDFTSRARLVFQPPLGGTPFEQPWLITCPTGLPLLNLEQALKFIQLKTRV